MATLKRPLETTALSSSPAFGTPLHPLPPAQQPRPPPPPAFKPTIATILPILLPPPTLRPLAFRTFTKKHNLTLNSSALQALATFIGRHCGSGWREEGTGEKVLEASAKLWKAESGGVFVEDGPRLKGILKTVEGSMSGGRIGAAKGGSKLSRENSFAFGNENTIDLKETDEHNEATKEPGAWLKVHSAYEQPRFTFDIDKKHFIQLTSKPSLFPPPSHKTAVFRERYNNIHQRLLRNEAFQQPSFQTNSNGLHRTDSTTAQQFYKITPIANLLGRGGTSHLLLGMLVVAPTGTLALTDLSGSIFVDLQHAVPLQGEDSAYFCPGMIVLIEGMYEEDWAGAGSSGLGNTGGVGGTIGGRFLGFSIGGPPVERRNISLGINLNATDIGGGFGWTDFLGLGSERAVGQRMRRLEEKFVGPQSEVAGATRRRMIVMSEVTLDQPNTLSAIRKVCEQYAAGGEAPMAFLLMGNFTSQPAMAGAGTGSIEYKEIFNELAAVLADFPRLLQTSTWVFVPGDNDPWVSAFGAGASSTIPRDSVPEAFTNRIKRAFAQAKSEAGLLQKEDMHGEAMWTSNPAKLSLFGPAHEVMIFRDDISGRFRRNAVRVGQATGQYSSENAAGGAEDVEMSGALPTIEERSKDNTQESNPLRSRPEYSAADDYPTTQAKKLILSLLPQSTLSPFPLATRPVHWDYAGSLSLYPLPHTLILADAETTPFAMTFEGCHVINPGRLVSGGGRRKKVQWCDYDVWSKRGMIMESSVG
ncbi:DNA polymerase epsilon subunit B [Teratosphaeria destructans]|uniref:DNA polymerase epsilon subunit B n=1 Tax=Teratosphaeria destructans TaxID=418781 RepID=A0A9W7SKH2_9PEZI|nr:DNA polymerase epsilon subunit B [Teratosphaeria destructans]